MKAMQAMTRDVICISPNDALEVAHDIMGEWDIRHLPVVEDGKLVGILSDRDVLLHSSQGVGREWDVEEVDVGDVMTPNPITCLPTDTIAHVARVMTERKIDSLPVVEEVGGDLIGLITSTDLLELLKEKDILDSTRQIPWKYQLKFGEHGARNTGA
jgi:acetoin utilization protein AcuB